MIPTKAAQKTIREDSTEVIIVGCTILSTMVNLKEIYSLDGVPVIDPVWAGIKLAKVLWWTLEEAMESRFVVPQYTAHLPIGARTFH